jgi:putative MATE family efflux protein
MSSAPLRLAKTSNLLEGQLQHSIWKLALPAMAASGVQIVFDLTHAWWVGHLGPIVLAALTAATFLVWMLFSLTQVLNTGVTALIARRIGENELDQAAVHARQGLILAPLAAGLSLLILWPILPAVLDWMGLEPAARTASWAYLRLTLLSYPVIWTYTMLQAIFVGRGDTRSSLKMVSLALVLNLLLDPLLIPALGLKGAAWASLSARSVGIVWGLWYLSGIGWLRAGPAGPIRDFAYKAMRIGLPHATSSVMFNLVFVGLTPIVTRFGSPALAAMGIGQRMETLIYSVLAGFGLACTSLVGQNLGAGQAERAERLVYLAALQAAGFCAVFTVLFWFGSPWVLPWFSPDPATQAHGISYVRLIGLALIPYSCELVFEGAFAGAGNTMPAMTVIIVGGLIRIPLAWYFAVIQGWGASGVWLTIALTMAFKGCSLLLWFQRGRWKEIKV